MSCNKNNRNPDLRIPPIGSFYGDKFIIDGGNRNDINIPKPIDAYGFGKYDASGVFHLDSRTSFASPEAQAFNKAGIIQINHIEKPIYNTTVMRSIIPYQTPNGIVYSDINDPNMKDATKSVPLVYPNGNPNMLFQSTGFIPVSNIPVITAGDSIKSYFTPYPYFK